MTCTTRLRAAVTGLAGFAATEEQALLAASDGAETGNATQWAAAPLVAHNTEFKQQQLQRLAAITGGEQPPEFGEIDHRSAEVYRGYERQPAPAVGAASWRVTGAILGGLRGITDADLLDPTRHSWLRGRQLWLQLIVRCFWHPTGHLGDYYLGHGQQGKAIDLAERAVTMAASLAAPDPARGMASYNLACALARADRPDDAVAALSESIGRNPDVRANAAREPDFAALRDTGRLADLLRGERPAS